ncbi:MAG: helix-turn-helix domain-containing protein [Dehalococcoidia bacterium]|nr:helix-turn-helix domain-containing protein [Dehalococcoidia bacterium]
MQQLLYTEAQVCEAYQLSRSTLRRKMAEGAITPVRIGRSIRFLAADVLAFVARLREEAQAQAER